MTQLTQLTVSFKEWATMKRLPAFMQEVNFMECRGSRGDITLGHAHALSTLTNLQSLSLTAPHGAWIFNAHSRDYTFLRQLTCLTSLTLAVVEKHKLAKALGACKNLQELHLITRCEERTAKRRPKLTASSSAGAAAAGSSSMQQLVQLGSSLTQLTSLQLQHYRVADAAALHQLLQPFQERLQLLRLDGLTAEAVPVLLGLTRLTDLRGTWKTGVAKAATQPQSSNGSGSSNQHQQRQQQQQKMVSVRKLAGRGPIPFQLFPNLREFEQWDILDADTFISLASHCKQLTAIKLAPIHRYGFPSMHADSAEKRKSALTWLAYSSRLQLKELHYAPRNLGEVEVLIRFLKLKRLVLRPDEDSECTCDGIGEWALGFKGEMLVLDFCYYWEDVMGLGLRAQLERQPNVIIRDNLER